MKRKILLLCLFLLLVLLMSSCGTSSEPSPTNTQLPPTVLPTNTPLPSTPAPTSTPFWGGPCDPSTEQIEINTRLKKGLGVGYTPPGKTCSVYCIHVPEGSQLLVGIADLDYQLNFLVGRDLFSNWDPGLPPHRGMLVGNKRIIVNPRTEIKNPSGRYYIYVCPGEDSGEFWGYEGDGNTITYTDAALFTLYNEFTL